MRHKEMTITTADQKKIAIELLTNLILNIREGNVTLQSMDLQYWGRDDGRLSLNIKGAPDATLKGTLTL